MSGAKAEERRGSVLRRKDRAGLRASTNTCRSRDRETEDGEMKDREKKGRKNVAFQKRRKLRLQEQTALIPVKPFTL